MTGGEDHFDVVVIGGGLAGASVAYHLVRAGARTALVDRHDSGRATDAGAGILSPETAQHPGEGWFELALACGQHYPDLVEELAATGQTDTGYARCGLVSIALADWDRPSWEELRDVAIARAARPGGPAVSEISADEARERIPALGQLSGALWQPGAARVDGRRLTAAVVAAASGTGRLTALEASVERLALAGDRVAAVEIGGRSLSCGDVVISGGAWTPSLAVQLGADVAVVPERGQIVHLHLPGADTASWPIVQPTLGHYVVPWPAGRLAIGATRERGAGFDALPTVAGLRQVLNEIPRVVPGLVDATFCEVRVGLRPVSADDLPILGPVPGVANVHLATGYGANGLLLGPWCGHLVASEIVAGEPDPTLDRWRLDRFRRG